MKNKTVKLNPDIFRAYDIRGIVGDDITPEVAEIIGKAIGTFLLQKKHGNQLIVGMDNRHSSEELKASLILGLQSTGCNIIDIGLCTSPMMYRAVYEEETAGGVIVSASHNPKEYNGFKVVGRQAYPVAAEDMYLLRDLAISGKFIESQAETTVTKKDTQAHYINKILDVIHPARKIKVVVDTGNGVAGKYAPDLYKRLGCDVVEVHCDLDGNFPNHLPNPEHEENLLDAMRAVVETGVDIGIGIDGDGDRVGLIDEQGRFLSADYTIILLARDYLKRHPGATVLIDVKSSMNVIDEIKRNGGVPLLYKTGHSLIKKKMRADGIMLGGEFSGHFYVFENYFPFDDALYSSSKIIEIISQSNKPISGHFTNLRKLYSTSLIELGCPDAVKFDVMDKVVSLLSSTYEVKNIDGARIEFPSGWAILRASNTSPFLTFRAESVSEQGLRDILEEMYHTLQRFPKIDLKPLDKVIPDIQ